MRPTNATDKYLLSNEKDSDGIDLILKASVISVVSLLFLQFIIFGCVDRVAGQAENIGCSFIAGKDQAHCYKDAAIRASDGSTCEKIVAEANSWENPPKSSCYHEVAVKTGDASLCAKMGPAFAYSDDPGECYQDVAVKTGNSSLCNNIKGSVSRMGAITASRELCLKTVGGTGAASGGCRFDSDCSPACEGQVFWKRGCDAQTSLCKNTFETDCAGEKTVIGTFEFPKLCSSAGCVEDTNAISSKKKELISTANDYTAAMQRTTELRQVASKNCLSALGDVTNKLIIETAITFSNLPSRMADVVTDQTKQALDLLSSNNNTMSTEEYISLNCNAVKTLDVEYLVLSKKRDKVMEQAKAFEGR